MATFSPDRGYFAQQVASLRQQSFTHWMCIVSDDASPEEHRRQIAEEIGDDPRFICLWHQTNVGFYRNFERALRAVPATARYVALCDQDDVWYADKLAQLVAALEREPRAMLAYSNMRIVDGEGRLISPTFWDTRKNSWDDLGLMLVANTVTGAASLFRRELLAVAIPFPAGTGDRYHDHVLACAALATGTIVYIDRPLYDYRQHRENVLGHRGRTVAAARRPIAEVAASDGFGAALREWLDRYRTFYCTEYLSRQALCDLLAARVPDAPPVVRHLFNGRARSIIGLLRLHLKARLRGATTNGAELDLLVSLVLARLLGYAEGCTERVNS